MMGFLARRLSLWMALAANSLPVPVSPWISTVASVGATLWMMLKTSFIGALLPIMPRLAWVGELNCLVEDWRLKIRLIELRTSF